MQETKLEDIQCSLGRTGQINYNAHLKPIKIAGSTVSRATLHNYLFIKSKDIRIGDHVFVQKAGDIIPEVVRVNLKKRHPRSVPYQPLTHCFSCGSKLVQNDNFVDQFCENPDCKIRKLKFLEYFVSKPCMNIQGLGEKKIHQLYKAGLCKIPLDLYRLHNHADQVLRLPG